MYSGADIKHDNAPIWADFDTTPTANTFGWKNPFGDGTRRSQSIDGNRTFQQLCSGGPRKKGQTGEACPKKLEKRSTFHALSFEIFIFIELRI
jgi:hypothetical protein